MYGFTLSLVLTQRELGNGQLISNAFRHGSVNYSTADDESAAQRHAFKHVPRLDCGHVCIKILRKSK